MAADKPSSFHCPNCNALYRVVEVEAGPDTVDCERAGIAARHWPAVEGI